MAEAREQPGNDEEAVMRIGKRVFCGNLAWKTSWQDLKDKFRECGTVVYSNVMRDDSGRSKGWGIVEFETPEEAVAAVNTFNGADLAGRKLLVREDREDRDVKQYNRENGIETPESTRPRRPPRRAAPVNASPRTANGVKHEAEGGEPTAQSSGLQIVVQGIPWKYTWKELKAMFEDVGPIERADVVFGPDSRSRGYGTVRFETGEAAQAAIQQFHGSELEGRTLTVKMDRFA